MKSRVLSRLGAAFALILFAVIVMLVLRMIVLSPGLALALAPTVALLVYAAWLVFTGNGARKRNGIVLLGAGIFVAVVIIVLFFHEIDRIRLAIGVLVVAGLYAGSVAILRMAYWRERRSIGSSQLDQFQHPFLIINPRSGDGRAIKAGIDKLAVEQGIHTIMLKQGDTVQAATMRAVEAGADVLGISGGDGSIGAVAKIAMENQLPMVVLPGGTRCHFARDLGLRPEKIVDSLAAFNGIKRQIDAGNINGRIFLNNVSFGLYADIVDHPEYREHKLEVARSVISKISNGSKPPYSLRFRYGDREFKEAVQIVVAVNRYETLSMFDPTRRKSMDSGILQVSVVTKLDDTLVRGLLRSISIERLRRKRDTTGFYQWGSRKFTIAGPDKKLHVGVDGENEAFENPVEVQILPGALSVYVPAEGVRTRPERLFSTTMVRYLWRETVRGNPE